MHKIHRLRGLLALLLLTTAQGAMSQSYYFGAEVGTVQAKFQPEYRFFNGAPDGSFDNRANGSNLGLLAGYRWQLSPRYSLNVESKLSRSDASWKLDLPEPATFRYAVPMNFALSVLPTWQITDNFAMHLEAGIAMGRIELRKSATVTSQYDVKEWSPGAIAGFGFSFALADQWSVRLGHQRTWYKDLHFDSHLSNGTPVESIRSSTEQSTTNIALIRAF